ncbi:MAG TPA: trehalase family glycosidase [Kofleriaceae bacterium]|nr:trehalase family glycosidase [Kofleriaceae bacterium]
MDKTTMRTEAERLLRGNDRGGYCVPAPKLYPHQWNWDSAFIALGWRHIDPRRAARELTMLARGQWDDGLIPHIIFNPEGHYEPGPVQWHTVGAPGAPKNALASSITQPPVAATAARLVLERSGGDAEVERALRELVPVLDRWHAWFLRTRDPRGIGAPAIVHPWESGMDNAPRWDRAMARIEPGAIEYKRVDNTIVDSSQRPTRYDYDRYFFIVNERARLGFAPPHPATEPLLVADVAITAILARAEEDLAWLAGELGAAAPDAVARRTRLVAALNGPLWDETRGSFRDRDVVDDTPIAVDHVANFIPLFVGPDAVPPARARSLAARLEDPSGFGTPWPVPSVPPSDPAFEGRRYWRGPTWVNVNWLLIDGLRRCGETAAADRLAARTLELVQRAGFREYFDPLTGEGCGAEDFAWTAALAIDLLA